MQRCCWAYGSDIRRERRSIPVPRKRDFYIIIHDHGDEHNYISTTVYCLLSQYSWLTASPQVSQNYHTLARHRLHSTNAAQNATTLVPVLIQNVVRQHALPMHAVSEGATWRAATNA